MFQNLVYVQDICVGKKVDKLGERTILFGINFNIENYLFYLILRVDLFPCPKAHRIKCFIECNSMVEENEAWNDQIPNVAVNNGSSIIFTCQRILLLLFTKNINNCLNFPTSTWLRDFPSIIFKRKVNIILYHYRMLRTTKPSTLWP